MPRRTKSPHTLGIGLPESNIRASSASRVSSLSVSSLTSSTLTVTAALHRRLGLCGAVKGLGTAHSLCVARGRRALAQGARARIADAILPGLAGGGREGASDPAARINGSVEWATSSAVCRLPQTPASDARVLSGWRAS